jgi:hypothetical protein
MRQMFYRDPCLTCLSSYAVCVPKRLPDGENRSKSRHTKLLRRPINPKPNISILAGGSASCLRDEMLTALTPCGTIGRLAHAPVPPWHGTVTGDSRIDRKGRS